MTIPSFLTSFLEVFKVLSLSGLYMKIFFGVKLSLFCHTFVRRILCVVFSLVCLSYFGFFNASIIPCMFASCFFL